ILFVAIRFYIWLISLARHGSYEVIQGQMSVLVDKRIIESYFKELLQRQYPDMIPSCKVAIQKNHLHLMAAVPTPLSDEAISEFRQALSQKIGYPYDFSLELLIAK
ncbi:MAG TPA: hypothetical protein VN457_06055, partial [Chlamydiales bacterium]|nr:hypothetical protein [Chlamydiales bacterium]